MANTRTVAGTQAIERAFAAARRAKRAALVAYLTVGYPSPAESRELIPAISAGGADVIELGVPFSDPVADGPTIQTASQQALEAGTTPQLCFELCHDWRARGIKTPFILMGYYNPILAYGLTHYVQTCRKVGVDGLIVPDLPPEEAGALSSACRDAGLALIFLVAPNTPPERIAKIAGLTQGFLYVVSRLGTTGAELEISEDLRQQLSVVRQRAKTPIAVGFGVSRPSQVRQLSPLVDGIIVGSAIVREATKGPESLYGYVSQLVEATKRDGLK